MSQITFRPLTPDESLYRTCDAMLKHALSNGKEVPPGLIADFEMVSAKIPELNPLRMVQSQWMTDSPRFHLSKDDMMTLAHVRNTLLKIIAPARPHTLLLMQNDSLKNGGWQVFGSVPLLRRMLAAAFICLVLMISFGSSGLVMATGTDYNLFDTSGIKLLLNAGFLLSAAGLGASFSALFRARTYVTDCTYDPKYEASYWIEFAIGLIAGVILAEVIFIDPSSSTSSIVIGGKVSLAMLGGFSGLVVYRILNRLTYSIEALVREKTEDLFDAELKKLEAESTKAITETKTHLAREITKLQSEIVYKQLTNTELNAKLEKLVDDVVSEGYTSNRPTSDADAGITAPIIEAEKGVINHTNLESPEHDDEEYVNL